MSRVLHHPISVDHMRAVKLEAKGLSMADARVTSHEYDDGDVHTKCLLCNGAKRAPVHHETDEADV